jgi:uncharacterized protein YwgA
MVTPKDWTLLAISAAEGRPVTPVQIQKCLFLLSREIPQHLPQGFYEFAPYNYGPFNKGIYDDLDELASEGLVYILSSGDRRWKEYAATPSGLERSATIGRDVPDQVTEYLRHLMAWCRSKTFEELVSAVYNRYPEYRRNSVFQG